MVVLVVAVGACASAPETAPPEQEAPEISNAAPEVETEPIETEQLDEQVPASDVTLTIMTNMAGVANEVFGDVTREFTAETGIAVDYAAPAADFEALMRTRMATGDLPDVWSTHGWAVARYSPFLRPLNDQPWVDQISPMIAPMITGPTGNVYVIPVDMDIAGIVYNRDILASVDISVDDIRTWADFEMALEAVQEEGYIPIKVGGTDDWTIGQLGNYIAPSFFVTNEAHNYQDELLNGTFDWDLWDSVAEMIRDWNERGFFNIDATTSDYATITRELGQGNVAFAFFGNYAIADGNQLGPANLGMMWVPSNDPADEPTLVAGERLAVGVWNDTPYEEEALLFLEFLARPDVMARLAEANGMAAGFTGVQVDLGDLQQDYDRYANLRTFPYFDRVFLPGGMWDFMCDTTIGILNSSMTNEQVITVMRDAFTERFGVE